MHSYDSIAQDISKPQRWTGHCCKHTRLRVPKHHLWREMSQPLPLRALNHISRVCRDVQATASFYRDVLGFLEVKRPSSFDFEGAWLFNYGIGVHLIAGEPPARQAKIDPKSDHLSFQADSLQEVENRLRSMGFDYVKASIQEGGVEVTQLFFHDPENNMIEICDCDQLPVVPLEASFWCPNCVTTTLNSPACGSRPMQTGSISQDDEEEDSDRSSDSYMSAEPAPSAAGAVQLQKCLSVTGCQSPTQVAPCAVAWAADMSVSTPHTGIRRSCSMSTLYSRQPAATKASAGAGFRSPSVLLQH